MVNIIACVSKNGVIGRDNDLIWKIPDDLKRFKSLTSGNVIVMGRKTFESIGSKPLPNRTNVVVTRSKIDGVHCFSSTEEVLNTFKDKNIWVIGGQRIFESFLDVASTLEITEVDYLADGDVYFPNIPEYFKVISSIDGEHNGLKYKFITYENIRKRVRGNS